MLADGVGRLRPLRIRMAEAVRAAGKPQFVVEKDYPLSYLLVGIYAIPVLRDLIVFKGGTCLRKAYFAGYRFSEDLEFTARVPVDCGELERALHEAVFLMCSALKAHGPFDATLASEGHRDPHPEGQCSFRVRLQYPWMRTPDCSLKIEVTMAEPLLGPITDRALIHSFSGEALNASVPCYSLAEIAAERLRAFLQARRQLEQRGWSRNRPRDLYDLWHMHKQSEHQVDWEATGRMLDGKARARAVSFTGHEDFLDMRVLAGSGRDWEGQLAKFVSDLPPFADCLSELRTIVDMVLKDS
jgi:predicted nucleotidyltransferase component of viral defense system